MAITKKEFVSKNNLKTHKVWRKELHGRWNKVIHRVAILKEEVSSKGKNGDVTALPVGSEVFIDDIRGRINPQFRAKDENGKVWFIPVNKLEVVKQDDPIEPIDENTHEYRGGVRVPKHGENKNG